MEHNLSPFMLHWIGILLLAGNTPARWRLGTHMLRSASELGYVPSTLSLVRTFRSMPPHMFDRAANSLMYREANARFQKVVQAGTDPDALTLQGLIHARSVDEGKDVKALAAFNQATLAWQKRQHEKGNLDEETEAVAPGKGIQAAVATSKSVSNSEAVDAPAGREFVLPPPRKPRWDWEVSCVLEQAYILERTQGTTAEALRLFRVAALELDNPFGFLMLAKLMDGPRNSPERRTYLLKAAISGVPEACREIGELEALDAARQDLSQNERAEHHKLSKEWFRLAEGEDMASWIKDNIGNGDVKE
ncbi:hypothetical protein N0V82_004278 [Gnomoniopsis sp. IMI 355080]|nr:hypothetical protein N0V82_004278 [Gnomoniopsis sp. IMI 355080]